MTAAADSIARTRGHLMTGQRDVLNQLAGSIDGTTESITLSRAMRTLTEGARITVGLEVMYVWGTSGAGATVMRGADGSTATAHDAGEVVRVNPIASDFEILTALNDTLRDLSSPERGLYRVTSADFTYNPSIMGYDLGDLGDVLDIWRVRWQTSGPEKDWPRVPRSFWDWDQNADPADFASGNQFVLKAGGEAGRKVRVTYKAGFTPLASLTSDLLTDAGLHTEAHDLPPIGAAIRLTAGRDVKRSEMSAQPEPRRAEEVPMGGASQAMRPFIALYAERCSAERARLMKRYP